MKYPITVNGKPQFVGITTACTMLELWLDHKLVLTDVEFDELCDALFELLAVARDEQYRLVKSERPSEG